MLEQDNSSLGWTREVNDHGNRDSSDCSFFITVIHLQWFLELEKASLLGVLAH